MKFLFFVPQYAAAPVYNPPAPQTTVVHNGFDAGARFSGNSPPSIPVSPAPELYFLVQDNDWVKGKFHPKINLFSMK